MIFFRLSAAILSNLFSFNRLFHQTVVPSYQNQSIQRSHWPGVALFWRFSFRIIETSIWSSQLLVSYNWKIGFMPRRKVWTQQEDAVLRLLREERGLKKWSEIAKKMGEEFGITQRTGKQCRQRYHNHLDSSIVLRQWSLQEEATLRGLHAQMGNKWSIISQHLPGRSDNCVKNHFYSKLRRAMRKLKRLLHDGKSSLSCRHIHPSLLNNLVELTEQRFKNSSRHDEFLIEKSVQIVDCLFRLEQALNQGGREADGMVKRLVDDVMWVEMRLRKGSGGIREQKEASETAQETEKKGGRVLKEVGDDPFYEAFRRVCESIVLNNN